jgi:hypothetical protein
MKRLPPVPNRGGAYQHDASTDTLTRTETATGAISGDGTGTAAPPLPASASPRGARRLPKAEPTAAARKPRKTRR